MIDSERKEEKRREKEKVRKRMRVSVDPDNYEFIPAKEQTDYFNPEKPQRVGVYARVSTEDVRQTTSYELQKKYYEDYINKHPNWTLVRIYPDEGISGTSLKNRKEFINMIADAKAGKLDLIITKSVSRFARNVVDFMGIVRDLAELRPPVGVFFESEAILSLNDDSQMALTFQATMAEEESHIRSRSMETSLRMRLDNGLPLTPKLLGYSHDADGELTINPDEAPTVKLIFYMYLFGYTTSQIAAALTEKGRKTYLGNTKWSSSGIVQILRNERHCGDVLTRKTFTENYRTHRTLKNRGEKNQSRYLNHHTAIISRDDFIAVQRLLDNAKYGTRSVLPELRVIRDGIFRGFVIVNVRWAGFKENDYRLASGSVYPVDKETGEIIADDPAEIIVKAAPGDFDLSGFEIARSELFDSQNRPFISIEDKKMKFSAACVRRFGENNTVELLINPITRRLAIRPTKKENRNGIVISFSEGGAYQPRQIATTAFSETLFSLMGWDLSNRYRITGTLYEQDGDPAYIFEAVNTEAFFRNYSAAPEEDDGVSVKPLCPAYSSVRAVPEEWTKSFGRTFTVCDLTVEELQTQTETDWKLRLEGQLYETTRRLNVTGFEELRDYIRKELEGITIQEDDNE